MVDIVKGVLDGGWALLVGWVLPSALTVLLFALVVYPSVDDTSPFSELPATAATIAATAVVAGVVLSALQTPLYRILEGYTWPTWLFRWGHRRHVQQRLRLKHTLNYAGHAKAERDLETAEDELAAARTGGDQARVQAAEERVDGRREELRRWADAGAEAAEWLTAHGKRKPEPLPTLRRQALAERLERYPVEDEQILPTELGNAIRRFERFGPQHYGLDQQRLWYELTAVAPERVGKQVGQLRTAVDFFVSLLYGQVVVVAAAVASMVGDGERRTELGAGAIAAAAVAALAYRGAILATDEWAYSVQALINVGRDPLAKALSLQLPSTLAEERDMWRLVGRFLRARPAAAVAAGLDRYRIPVTAPDDAGEEDGAPAS
jgi:hypothetical protein